MSFIKKSIRELTPSIIAYEEEIPPEEFEEFVDSVYTYINTVSKLFKIFYRVIAVIAVFLPLFTKGRIFFWLNSDARDEYLNGLYHSRFKLIRAVGTLIGIPMKMVYYSSDKEMLRLGFDRQALIKEARLRNVTRDRTA